MGLFCLSRHLWLLFRSQSRSGCVERVRGCPVRECVECSSVPVFVVCNDSPARTFKVKMMLNF